MKEYDNTIEPDPGPDDDPPDVRLEEYAGFEKFVEGERHNDREPDAWITITAADTIPADEWQ